MKGRTVSSPMGTITVGVEGERISFLRLPGTSGPEWEAEDDPLLAEACRQLDAYFAGRLQRFDLPLGQPGTPFQQAVWSALVEIPFGETRAYGAIARQIGKPEAVRAVGAANGRNQIAIIVPCHRVIGASGSLVGFAGGLSLKRWLLGHERGERPLFVAGGG